MLQDTLMNLAKAVANAAAMLVLKAKNVAQVAEDTILQNRVIAAATQCALSTSQLVACTKVLVTSLATGEQDSLTQCSGTFRPSVRRRAELSEEYDRVKQTIEKNLMFDGGRSLLILCWGHLHNNNSKNCTVQI